MAGETFAELWVSHIGMGTDPTQPPLELWAGIECTVNRVRNQYFDQIEQSGHAGRLDDLNLFASLGIRTLRYPILWERTSNARVDAFDWTWADQRLARLKDLAIRPIVGLVHHGSGPLGTSLADPSFSEGLARYGREVARRYPWVRDFTPVNEPLTTARFAGLYGHWYPHGSSQSEFARAFLEQARAIVLTMRAIREITPEARLIQTEDLGKTHSTPSLDYQADFENSRRWITWDLLCGRLDCDHPMWSYLTEAGIPESELEWFLGNTCEPDIIGVNHYLTSERFLDDRTALYPPHVVGGNAYQSYADVEAVRVLAAGGDGPAELLREVSARYGRPVAITEVHNGCTREEQIRWLVDVWTAAKRAREDGNNVVAVTAWALLGAFDWDSLVTRSEGHYEPGLFDLRAPRPRPTALAHLTRRISEGAAIEHPLLDIPGWWRRPERLIFGTCYPEDPTPQVRSINVKLNPAAARPVLITGKTGTLGQAFARACEARGIVFRLLGRDELDIGGEESVAEAIARLRPWAIVNTAGYVRVDEAEQDRLRCLRENTTGPAILAAACAERGIRLITISSDLVFDGQSAHPYLESDAVNPLNVYGESKAQAERRVLELCPEALVVRTSAFFGPWDEHNFVIRTLRALADGEPVRVSSDIVSPTYVPDLVNAALDLLIDEETGIWHLANVGAVSWVELARQMARAADLDSSLVIPSPAHRLGWIARRPHYSPLASERGSLMPTLQDAIDRYLRHCTVEWRVPEKIAVGS